MLHSLVGKHRSPVIDTADSPMIALEMRDEVNVHPIYVVLVFNCDFGNVLLFCFGVFSYMYLEK